MKPDEKDAVDDDDLENSIQRPNRTTGRTGCSAFIYIRKDVKLAGEPWTVRSSCFEHNHPLSEDKRAYHSNRKLNADDQEFAISLMRGGTTPSETLKVMFKNEIKRSFEKSIVRKAVIIIKVILPILFFISLNMSPIYILK